MKLENKIVLVTGASSGIGLDLVKALLKENMDVVAISRRIEEINLNHKRLTKKNFDLSKQSQIDAMFQFVFAQYNRLDLFIANAGFSYYEYASGSDWKHIEDIFRVNTLSVLYSATQLKAHMKDAPFNFVATASAASFLSMPGHALYSATKAALRGFMDGYRLELPKHQKLQTVFPVATKTNFFNKANQSNKPWPVQTSEHVAKVMIKGIKKDKKNIYPSKLFKYGFKLTPWFFALYMKRQTRLFHRTKNKKIEE